MVHQERRSSLAEFDGVFRHFDRDGDGMISSYELRLCLNSIGEELSPDDVEELLATVDSDGDGFLGLDDFTRLVASRGEEEEVEDLREAFEVYAMEGVGHITPGSLRRTLSRLGNSRSVEECENMICRFDLDRDGVLSFEEFKIMMLY